MRLGIWAGRFFYLMVFFIWSESGESRVFRMKNETVASYFGATYGPSVIKQSHFIGTAGAGATMESTVLSNYGGEFGVLFTNQWMGMRFGVELIRPRTLQKAMGLDGAGTELFQLESSISALIPKLALEFNLKTADTWRVFMVLGGGTATATFSNAYVLTAAGQTAYPGLADFAEEATGSALLYDGGFGFETLMNDTTTIALSVGYRKLDIPKYKYKLAVTNFMGSHLQSDDVINADGTAVATSFTGAVGAIFFRFYLGK